MITLVNHCEKNQYIQFDNKSDQVSFDNCFSSLKFQLFYIVQEEIYIDGFYKIIKIDNRVLNIVHKLIITNSKNLQKISSNKNLKSLCLYFCPNIKYLGYFPKIEKLVIQNLDISIEYKLYCFSLILEKILKRKNAGGFTKDMLELITSMLIY